MSTMAGFIYHKHEEQLGPRGFGQASMLVLVGTLSVRQIFAFKRTQFLHLELGVGTRQGEGPLWLLGIPVTPHHKDSHLLHSWIMTPVRSHGCPRRQAMLVFRNKREMCLNLHETCHQAWSKGWFEEGQRVSSSSSHGSCPGHLLNRPNGRHSAAPVPGREESHLLLLFPSAMAGLGTSPATSSSTSWRRSSSSSMESGSEMSLPSPPWVLWPGTFRYVPAL